MHARWTVLASRAMVPLGWLLVVASAVVLVIAQTIQLAAVELVFEQRRVGRQRLLDVSERWRLPSRDATPRRRAL